MLDERFACVRACVCVCERICVRVALRCWRSHKQFPRIAARSLHAALVPLTSPPQRGSLSGTHTDTCALGSHVITIVRLYNSPLYHRLSLDIIVTVWLSQLSTAAELLFINYIQRHFVYVKISLSFRIFSGYFLRVSWPSLINLRFKCDLCSFTGKWQCMKIIWFKRLYNPKISFLFLFAREGTI